MDTVAGEFNIPANTQVRFQTRHGALKVQAMIDTIMSQDPVFEQPWEFRPERFLQSDGKTFKKEVVERVIPFSIGKRMCAGEGLARMELFMGLVAFLQAILPCKPASELPHQTSNRCTFELDTDLRRRSHSTIKQLRLRGPIKRPIVSSCLIKLIAKTSR